MIHKRILDEVETNPNASLEQVAHAVAGASVDLVESVLDEYSDPATESAPSPEPGGDQPVEPEASEGSDSGGLDETDRSPAIEELSEIQRETLEEVKERPSATQREIGEALGVSAVTISRRLSDIAGFAWQDRRDFVASFFESPLISDGKGAVEAEAAGALESRVDAVERRLDDIESGADRLPHSPELVHKVIHACMRSEQFSEAEELADLD